ncbi:LysR family transcriptional regulator [Viridibacillus sp. FSL R5-0477]|uniref:LysR family transcriptional regulator n=1 Tax=Viridibacillus arenosi FSL R5-213 TaxID=1227360 RepID=W4F5B4_9BACL|nr:MULTISPECIES: LysR family transcriptional regulator [Viridibacillus]ETT88073.1 LysR family transcriptional regulator [Viridibacillus arenosi FSL R5-213]OMC78508.1 LysR family transcriptional regulator [Viridibacillus sp. FSL H8-0123]OMC82784.1 LysR family transcriptional regulator [Viridibacillus sp. FSL H7-0596]OMC88100.1 LysR family transcriptional regulator [Viridibacillus arenosi]
MNNLKLQAFCLLVNLKKLAPVAKELGITAPTVSFHIRSIEEEYGVRLFRTNAGGYRLTEAGEGLYHYARQIVQLQKDMNQFFENLIEGNIGSIRLGASGLPAHIFMPDIIDQISTAYPDIRISLEVKTAPEIERKLILQELDFGLIMETKQEDQALIYETIGEDSLVLALSPTHELATKKDISKSDVLKSKILLHTSSSSTNHFIGKWLDPFAPSIYTIELDSVSTIKKMLTYGKTLAFISIALMDEELKSGTLLKKELNDITLTRKIQLVYPKCRLDSKIDEFVKKVIHTLAYDYKAND